MKRALKIGMWLVTTLIVLSAIYGYLQYEKHYSSTDDAYVQANIVYIAAQVSGSIIAINTEENAEVNAGQWLVKIDPKPFEIAVNQAQAKLMSAKQQVITAEEVLHVAEAALNEKKARLTLAEEETLRILPLVKKNLASKEVGDQQKSQLKIAIADEKSAKSQLQQEQSELSGANANVKIAQAEVEQAELNLQHTVINSSVTGKIVNFSLRVGDVVNPDIQLFAIVDTSHWWVQANFKETDLESIKPGQKVEVTIDMYPGKVFNGIVESLSGGSGAAFSLLPPENAAGNWVKVTQRFPIRITLEQLDEYPFRVGASAVVKVNTIDK